jgi:hypothetical protein
MKKHFFALLLLLITSTSDRLFSQVNTIDVGYIDDSKNIYTLSEVRDLQFTELEGGDYALSNPDHTYWVRFKMPYQTNETVGYAIIPYFIKSIQAFYPSDSGYKASYIIKYDLEDDPDYIYRFKYLKLPLINYKDFYYAKVKINSTTTAFYGTGLGTFFNDFYMFKAMLREYTMFTAIFTILITMIVFSLVLYIRTWERLYLYYALYVVAAALLQTILWGIVLKYTYIATYASGSRLYDTYAFAFSSMIVFLMLYTQAFLQTRKNLPKLHWVITATVSIKIIMFTLGALNSDALTKIAFHNPKVDVVLLLPSFIAGIVSYFKKIAFSSYFVVAFAILFTGLFLHAQPLVYIPNFGNPLYLFITAESIVFFAGLADRLRSLRNEKEIVLEEKLIQMEEIDSLKDKVNRELEDKVTERTEQLRLQSLEIEKMNSLLVQHNFKLEEDVKGLSKARVTHKPVSFEEFKLTYPDEESCLKYLSDLKWGSGFKCRKCGNTSFIEGKSKYAHRCNKCWYEETPTVGTIFHKLKFPVEKAFYLLFLVTNNKKVSIDELARTLGLSERTCWSYKNKIADAIDSKKKGKHQDSSWGVIIMV